MTPAQDDTEAKNSQPSAPGLGDRILGVVRAFLRSERSPEDTALGEDSDDLLGVVERSLQHWTQNRRRSHPWHQQQLDALGLVGHPVELLARLDGAATEDVTVTFFVDGVEVGAGAMTDLGVAVRAYVPDALGMHTITTELRDEAGVLVDERAQSARLQVVADAPVVIVDAHLLDAHEPQALQPLRELVARGLQLCWADRRGAQRARTVVELIAAAGLPPAAVLTIDDRELDFDTLGVDFGPVNERLLVRRLRALGVPLVAAVTASPAASQAESSGLVLWSLVELASALADVHGLEALCDTAAHFVVERDHAEGVAALSRRLDLMTSTKAVAGNEVSFELDNQAARHALFADIRAAAHSVHLQFYVFEAGRFVTELSALLRERARAGVKVRLVVDALYARHRLLGRVNPLLAELEAEPGIEIRSSDPLSVGDLGALAFKQRDHRKLAIIDGHIAFVTGRNGADTYYLGFDEVVIDDDTLHEVIPWLDAHARLRGPLAAELEAIFVANWRRNGGTLSDAEVVSPPPNLGVSRPAGGVSARVVLHDGVGDAFSLASYDALFAGARERLIVVNDFPIISDLSLRLIAAAQRGVKVDILTGNGVARRGDGTFFEGPRHRELFEYMVKRCYEPLIRAGVRVSEFVAPDLPNIRARGGPIRPFVHAKVVVVDGLVASVGTANLDVTASHWEREVNLVIESPAVAGSLMATLDALLDRSYLIDITSEYWLNEAARRALAGQLWPDRLYQ